MCYTDFVESRKKFALSVVIRILFYPQHLQAARDSTPRKAVCGCCSFREGHSMSRIHEYNFRGKLAVAMAKTMPPYKPEWDEETKRSFWDALGEILGEGLELAKMRDEIDEARKPKGLPFN